MGSRRKAPGLVNPNDNDDKTNAIDAMGAETIANSIEKISKAMETIERTRLTRQALVALIHDQSNVSKKTINIILNNLVYLSRDWLKRATP